MFDTHCHLNFKVFEGKVTEVIGAAKKTGVNYFLVAGTEVENSKKAVAVAEKFDGVYAAVGVHPHHLFEIFKKAQYRVSRFNRKSSSKFNDSLKNSKQISSLFIKGQLKKIEDLLINKKVVAIGEVGIDCHYYRKTKYDDYQISEEFIELQKDFLKTQIDLAVKYDKSLILHNRQAKDDLLEVLKKSWDKKLEGRTVFHCCEADDDLLDFAQKHKIFIGVDGDVVYNQQKQSFIRKIPLELLVLETDAPFLSPFKKFPNEPKNIKYLAEFIADFVKIPPDELIEITTANAKRLFLIF